MSERMVNCTKLGEPAPGLDTPPFDDELGQEIFEKVSAQAWKMWTDDVMIKVINEYRLNMADPNDYNTVLGQMRSFLNLSSDEQLEVDNPERGRS